MLRPNVSLKIEIMGEEFQKRLRKLGVVKGARSLRGAKVLKETRSESAPRAVATPLLQVEEYEEEQPIERLLPGGRIIHNEFGSAFVVDGVYPLNYKHGDRVLGDLLLSRNTPLADFLRDERLREINTREFLFLDSETTGLSGAGTFAFMIGAAYFDGDALVVRQYFARDPGEEPAMLLALAEKVNSLEGLITFNGRSFDLPLLDNRYFMNRLDSLIDDLRGRPHIDLLHPARRLWRKRLGSCSLNSLEKNLLSIYRTHEDVPGWLIPGIYMDYLRRGDAREIVRVFYHNHIDMLSMVTLTVHVFDLISKPTGNEHPLDMHSLAKWQIALGYRESAEEILKLALKSEGDQSGSSDLNIQLRHDLGMLLRKMDRRQEAVGLWQQIIEDYDSGPQAPLVLSATIELAKYYEWHERDLGLARRWTIEARALSEREGGNLGYQNEAIDHRLARIERKLASMNDH
ncbi:MAG: metal-dependent exonucleaseMrfB [Anaerolineae bacterium]|nr:MAG: metal-dependent exonucleaseMrfB [Anaerolineae bacterium]